MAYEFQNQLTATAQVARAYEDAAPSEYLKIAGINGRQTNATNFRAAISGLVGIVGISLYDADSGLRRTITQNVKDTSGTDPQFSIDPDTVNLKIDVIAGGDGCIVDLSYLGTTRTISYSGKKPRGCTITENDEEGDRWLVLRRNSDTTYTSGSDHSADLVITVAAGEGYREASATLHMTSGAEEDFVDANE